MPGLLQVPLPYQEAAIEQNIELGRFSIWAIVMLNHIFARLMIVLQTLADQESRQNVRLRRLEDSVARIEAALAKIEDLLTPEPAVSLNLTTGPVVEQPTK